MEKRWYAGALTALLLVLLTGCLGNTPLVQGSGAVENVQNSKEGYGYILGSIGTTTKFYMRGTAFNWSEMTFVYDGDASKRSKLTVHHQPTEQDDVRTKEMSESIFLYKVPTGSYTLQKIAFEIRKGKIYQEWNKKPLDITFDVKEGQITYIGSFNAQHLLEKAEFVDVKVPGKHGYFVHSYKLERDQKIALKKYPGSIDRQTPLETFKTTLFRPGLIVSDVMRKLYFKE